MKNKKWDQLWRFMGLYHIMIYHDHDQDEDEDEDDDDDDDDDDDYHH